MKKILKIAGITLGAIVLLLFILPFFFKGKITQIVKEEGNRMLNAQFDFGALDISLLRHFPSVSVTLEDFWMKGTGDFANDTLVEAGELTAAVNLFSLFGNDGYDISKIIIRDTHVHAIVLEKGLPNWEIMKTGETTASQEKTSISTVRVKLKQVKVDGLTVVYDDRQGGLYAEVCDLKGNCAGDFGSERTVLDMDMETPALTYRMGGVPMLNRVALKTNLDVDADFANGKYTLKKNSFRLNAIEMDVDGWVHTLKDGIDMDVRLNTNEVGFKELLSLIPAIYTKGFEELKTDGKATLTAFAKGCLKGDTIVPQFEITLDVKNAMFRYPTLPAGVDGINIVASVKNEGGSADATMVTVNPFDFVLAGNPFSMKIAVNSPVTDPDFRAVAKGKLDLGKIKDVYPLEDMQLNGLVNADMKVSGKLSYIEKEQYEQMQAGGSIRLENMKISMAGVPDVHIERSLFSFSPRYLQLSETTVKIGNNDLTLDSRLENYLGYVLRGTTLKGVLNVNSNLFNLNDFMSRDSADVQTTADTTVMGVIRVPENIDFSMQANMKKVLFDKMTLQDVKGSLLVRNGKVDMKNLSFNTMGGQVVMNGAYTAKEKEQPVLDAGFTMKDISFSQAYKELGLVQQMAPVFEGLKGNFSGNMKIHTPLNEQMSPIMEAVQGNGTLSTKDLSLSDVKFIDQVADIVKKPSMKDIKVKDLNIDFEIADGRVNTKPFDLRLGDYTMNLSGSTGLDQTIDYRGKITMPTDGIVGKLGTVDMTIGGTFASPKVGIDMASLAKNAAEQALKGLGDKLNNNTSGTEEKKSVIDKALDLFKKKK